MKALIIDISIAPFREYVHRYGVADGLLFGCWYRILRPLLVILTWVAFSLYIYHSLVTVGGTAAQIAELLVYMAIVANMAMVLIAWMVVCRFHGWIRARDGEEEGRGLEPVNLPLLPRIDVPIRVRLLRVYHDDSGTIVRVQAWPEMNDVEIPPDTLPESASAPPPEHAKSAERVEPTLSRDDTLAA